MDWDDYQRNAVERNAGATLPTLSTMLSVVAVLAHRSGFTLYEVAAHGVVNRGSPATTVREVDAIKYANPFFGPPADAVDEQDTMRHGDGTADYRIFRDGNKWCATLLDFVNLQESPVGFGDTTDEAVNSLLADLKAARWGNSTKHENHQSDLGGSPKRGSIPGPEEFPGNEYENYDCSKSNDNVPHCQSCDVPMTLIDGRYVCCRCGGEVAKTG